MPIANTDNMADVAMAVAEDFVRDLAAAIHAEIVTRTPVKTGRAMGSWSVSLVTPPSLLVHEGLATSDRTANAAEAAARAIRFGQAIISRYKLDKVPILWIANPVSYMDLLEVGSSRQAPAGVVAQSIQSVMARFSPKFSPMRVMP